MIPLIQDILSYTSIGIGVLFMLIAGIGIIRLPDFYIRMSAITKAGTMGVGFIVLGISIHFNDLTIAIKSFVIVSFMLLTSPVAAHIISRAAYRENVPFWKKNLFDQLADKVQSLKDTEEAVSQNPADIGLKWKLIEHYTNIPSMMGGSSRKAVIVASDIKDLDIPEGHVALGTVYMKDREYNQAEEEFLLAVEDSGRNPKYLAETGKFYRFTDDYEKSLRFFEEAVNRDPDQINFLLEFGRTTVLAGTDLEKGEKCLKSILSRENEKPALLADAAYQLAEIFKLRKDLETAKGYYKKALEYRPGHAHAQFRLDNLK
jgi:multicomponent Na+:H+ antiporter subunit G